MDLNILVVGGAGFIGSNIVERLAKMSTKYIRVVDNLSTGYRKNINFILENNDNIEFVYGDITNLEVCRSIVKDIDVVCHQAALGSVPRSVDNPLNSHNNNVNGTLNLLIACKEAGIKRFVYASSSSVYGDDENLPKVENSTGNPLSPYAVTKYVCELYANVFTKLYDMECIGLRYFNVFGPRQDPNGAYAAVIPKFIHQLINNEQPIINGDGNYSRDFTYIDNIVDANILALTLDSNMRIFGDAYNIGYGGRVTINDMFYSIKQSLENLGYKTKNPIYGNLRKGDIPHSNASINKANNKLGYEPKISFEEGIKRTVGYFVKK